MATFLHISPFVAHVRFYDVPDGYKNRTPYKAIATITYLTETAVYLSGAVGELALDAYPALLAALKADGVTTVMSERHGQMKTRIL